MSNADDDKEQIRKGIDLLADYVFRMQSTQGIWPEDGQIDMASFFADLHGKLANAYTDSKDSDPTSVVWVNPETGEETSPGTGIPSGLMVSMTEIFFDVLGLYRAIGVNPGVLLADLGVAYQARDPVSVESVDTALEMAAGEDGK